MTKQIGHLIRVRETCSCGRKTRATFYGGRCTFLRQGVHAPTCLEVAKHEKDKQTRKQVAAAIEQATLQASEDRNG